VNIYYNSFVIFLNKLFLSTRSYQNEMSSYSSEKPLVVVSCSLHCRTSSDTYMTSHSEVEGGVVEDYSRIPMLFFLHVTIFNKTPRQKICRLMTSPPPPVLQPGSDLVSFVWELYQWCYWYNSMVVIIVTVVVSHIDVVLRYQLIMCATLHNKINCQYNWNYDIVIYDS